MSCHVFAGHIGVTAPWLSKYYHGKVKLPSGRIAQRIIDRLDGKTTFDELMSMKGRGERFSIHG